MPFAGIIDVSPAWLGPSGWCYHSAAVIPVSSYLE